MRVEFKTDARNLRVRGALLGIGGTFEGIFRKHMVLPDSIRDSAWYAIVDDDWPRVRAMLEAKIERHADLMRCAVEFAALRAEPDDAAEQVTQALRGEPLRVEERARRLGAGRHRVRLSRLDACGRARRGRREPPRRRGGLAGRRRPVLPGDAVSLGWDDRARASTAPGSSTWPTGASAGSCRATPTSRRTPGVEVDEPRPGDLVTYGDEVADHIAFWLGDGRILHSTGRDDGIGVVEEPEPDDLRARRRKLVRL